MDRTVYDGVVLKCPNCGETLQSFVSFCPTCGLELRGSNISNSVREFSEMLGAATDNDSRIMLISNYPIPNTKEDIFEFMILASSNIANGVSSELNEAWRTKFEQCYQKAKMVFGNSEDFDQIQELYNSTQRQVNRQRVSNIANTTGKGISKFISVLPNPVFGIVLFILLVFELIRLFTGNFVPFDLIMCIVILVIVYSITTKKSSNNRRNRSANQNQISDSTAPPKPIKIKIPSSVRNGYSDNYAVIESLLIQAGFTNVRSIPLQDLMLGLMKKNGTVESIMINGKEMSSYFRYKFEPDVPIVISYHSFR